MVFTEPYFCVLVKVELGKGLGKDGLSVSQLQADGYEAIFIGIGE